MENFALACGFRFHPTDEELVDYYLFSKAMDNAFTSIAIAEVDLNKCEPWDLPWRAKMGERELYFYSVRDRKYPTGSRTNRATEAGYWKATGKDKEVMKANKLLIGMKKTLVFYTGRAPRGEKTNWVMHEYRLDATFSKYNLPSPPDPMSEWVVCRIFKKGTGGRRLQIRFDAYNSCELPPLMDASPYNNTTNNNSLASPNQVEFGESSHVTCFSDVPNQQMEYQNPQPQDIMVDSLETTVQTVNNPQFPENFLSPEVMRMLMENPVPTNDPIPMPIQNDDFSGVPNFEADDISSFLYSSNNNNDAIMVNNENPSGVEAYFPSPDPAGPEDIDSLWNL